jgi:hypothetical protein
MHLELTSGSTGIAEMGLIRIEALLTPVILFFWEILTTQQKQEKVRIKGTFMRDAPGAAALPLRRPAGDYSWKYPVC